MTYAIMLGVFVVLLFLGAPIALSLGMSSLLAILYNGTGINVIAGRSTAASASICCWPFRSSSSRATSWPKPASPTG